MVQSRLFSVIHGIPSKLQSQRLSEFKYALPSSSRLGLVRMRGTENWQGFFLSFFFLKRGKRLNRTHVSIRSKSQVNGWEMNASTLWFNVAWLNREKYQIFSRLDLSERWLARRLKEEEKALRIFSIILDPISSSFLGPANRLISQYPQLWAVSHRSWKGFSRNSSVD